MKEVKEDPFKEVKEEYKRLNKKMRELHRKYHNETRG